eukprot:TRINITY_DN3482_c1_g1_i2.p1 TRINITY_DN3482_c1_g1~~TRINITY_DN3482_c1_g1_i2.p1  ORF type:complete len:444 (+),score=79.49 TRINITY_DN3482_c1_g1_i2:608-1939(+)
MQSIFHKLSHLGRQSKGNEVSVFYNTSEVMEDIWREIDGAKEEILMLTYIMKHDGVGEETLARLHNAAGRGVKVRLLYDDAGNITGRKKLIRDLQNDENGSVTCFRPFWRTWWDFGTSGFAFLESPVLRNHRKILVIDENIGYIGGLNIGNEYAGRPCTGLYLTAGKTFRDNMVKVKGPAVMDLKEMVCETMKLPCTPINRSDRESWMQWLGKLHALPCILPREKIEVFSGDVTVAKPVSVNGVDAQLTGCDPWSRDYGLQKSLFIAMKEAKDRIWITTPYYSPPEHLQTTLEEAALRGVDVRICVGGKGTTDPPIMRHVQQNWFPSALASGVKIYEYNTPGEVMHAKMFSVDGAFASLGSYNLDLLSDRILEANMGFAHPEVCALVEQQFLFDTSKCDLLTTERFESRQWNPLSYSASKISLGIYSTARWILSGDYDHARDM